MRGASIECSISEHGVYLLPLRNDNQITCIHKTCTHGTISNGKNGCLAVSGVQPMP